MFIEHDAIRPSDFEGLKIVDYSAGRDTSSSFAEITVPPGVRHRSSWSRRSDKYYYVVQGSIAFTLDGATRCMSPGDICIVSQGARFSYVNSTSNDAKLILVHTPSFSLDREVFEEK